MEVESDEEDEKQEKSEETPSQLDQDTQVQDMDEVSSYMAFELAFSLEPRRSLCCSLLNQKPSSLISLEGRHEP